MPQEQQRHTRYAGNGREHVVVVVPGDADVDEPEHVGQRLAWPPLWLGVVSERAQHAAVDPERLQDSERVVEGEDVGGG
jgi:hypothetical protein